VRQLHRQRQGLHAEREGQQPYTGRDEEPDERLDAQHRGEDQHPRLAQGRLPREIMNYIGALAIEGRTFNYKTNERLHRRSS
jgi:serine protein kinase